MRNILIFALLIAISYASGMTKEPEIRCELYQAYINGDMTKWEVRLNSYFDRDIYTYSDSALKTLLYGQYGLIGYQLGNDKKEAAAKNLERADDILDRMLDAYPRDASLLAMKAAFYGYRIDLNKRKAIHYGKQSVNYLEKAVESDSNNPMVWIEKGNAKFHMPKIAGGSVEEAIDYYQKALRLFESSNYHKKCNWLYLNSLVRLAMFFKENGQQDLAVETYRKALDNEPDFLWVKDKLLPALKKRR